MTEIIEQTKKREVRPGVAKSFVTKEIARRAMFPCFRLSKLRRDKKKKEGEEGKGGRAIDSAGDFAGSTNFKRSCRAVFTTCMGRPWRSSVAYSAPGTGGGGGRKKERGGGHRMGIVRPARLRMGTVPLSLIVDSRCRCGHAGRELAVAPPGEGGEKRRNDPTKCSAIGNCDDSMIPSFFSSFAGPQTRRRKGRGRLGGRTQRKKKGREKRRMPT